jgi:hypothetical protein
MVAPVEQTTCIQQPLQTIVRPQTIHIQMPAAPEPKKDCGVRYEDIELSEDEEKQV